MNEGISIIVDYLLAGGYIFPEMHKEYIWNIWCGETIETQYRILGTVNYSGLCIIEQWDGEDTLVMYEEATREDAFMFVEEVAGNDDYFYAVSFDGGGVANSADLFPNHLANKSHITWILGGGGLANYIFYAKNKKAFADMVSYCDGIVFKNGKIIN